MAGRFARWFDYYVGMTYARHMHCGESEAHTPGASPPLQVNYRKSLHSARHGTPFAPHKLAALHGESEPARGLHLATAGDGNIIQRPPTVRNSLRRCSPHIISAMSVRLKTKSMKESSKSVPLKISLKQGKRASRVEVENPQSLTLEATPRITVQSNRCKGHLTDTCKLMITYGRRSVGSMCAKRERRAQRSHLRKLGER